jgi:serine O-acetyltransferase
MDYNVEQTVEKVLESYKQHDITVRLDADNTLNKEVLIQIIEEMRKILFPGFFEENRMRSDYAKYIVGSRIEFVQYNLKKQVARALGGEKNCAGCPESDTYKRAGEIVEIFLNKIPEIRETLFTDVQAALDGDPAASSTDEIILSYPGLYAITVYRVAHELAVLEVPLIPRIMSEYAHSITGIDIHPLATIGKYFFIDHGTGIVVGSTTKIGDNVKIYQGVTLGALSTRHGQALRGVKRHPTIGNNVTIYSNTTILGGDTVIGDNVTVGGNAFVVKSISSGMKVSAKSPELEYKSEEKKDGLWDWII